MNKTNQFSAKTQYVTPWCRSVELRSARTILTESNWGDTGKAGGTGFYDDTEEDERM